MPIIRSAIKKVRQDKKRTLANKAVLKKLKDTLKKAKRGSLSIPEVFSIIDRAAKKNVIHKNKASRLKSEISKKIEKKEVASSETKVKSTKRKQTTKKAS